MPPPYPTSSASELDAVVRAVCPQIDGVSVDGAIFFQAGASPASRTAAQNAMQNFVPTDPAIEQSRQAAIRSDVDRSAMLARLKTASPVQIDTWVTNNVTTLTEARKAIGIILKLIALDGRQ